MDFQKEGIIKKYIFEETASDEEKKERFKIAYDVWFAFPIICEYVKEEFFKRYLSSKLIDVLGEEFFCCFYDFSKVDLFNIALSKNAWKVGDNVVYSLKLNRQSGGYYELGLERWVKDVPQDVLIIEERIKEFVARSGVFNRCTQWWKFRWCFGDRLSDADFILELLFSPETRLEFFVDKFMNLARFLKEEIEDGVSIERQIDKAVEYLNSK